MSDLQTYQYVLIGLIFIWSGFVRTGLGFGGSVLSLPFLLLVHNDPLVFMPLIAVHLLFFSSLIAWQGFRKARAGSSDAQQSQIDWTYLKHALKIMIVPKLIGVIGLITLPASFLTVLIFGIIFIYSLTYIFNKPFKSNHPAVDVLLLMLGGYVSGTSLVAAPLIIAVFATHVAKEKLRDTLFVLWFILVTIKLASLIIAGVNLQLIHHLWLLPCAFIGHLFGERLHQRLVTTSTTTFFRILGVMLLIVSIIGVLGTPL